MKYIKISAMIVAVVFIITGTIIPHHHHGAKICTTVEHCDEDDADNNCHTGHTHHGAQPCLEKGTYIVKEATGGGDCRETGMFPLSLLATVLSLAVENDEAHARLYYTYQDRILPSGYAAAVSLRAPPVFI